MAVEYVSTLGPAGQTSSTTITISAAVSATGPDRKLVAAREFAAGGSRTTSTFSYNGVAFNVIASNESVTSGLIFGYLDDASLPTDGAAHDLVSVMSSSVTQQGMGAVLYRGVTVGVPVDSDTVSNNSTPSLTLTDLAAGALAVAAVASNVNSATMTWENSENERFDFQGALNVDLSIGDIIGTAGTSQTLGGTQATSTGAERAMVAAWLAAAAGAIASGAGTAAGAGDAAAVGASLVAGAGVGTAAGAGAATAAGASRRSGVGTAAGTGTATAVAPEDRVLPAAILADTNLSGAVGDIDESPTAPDGSWLTADSATLGTMLHVSFGSPGGNLEIGADLQEFRAWVRKTAGAPNPTF